MSRNAALAMASALPGDAVLYLLLPIFAAQFGVTLTEAGILLAANRMVRIAGYRYVQEFYAHRGDAMTNTLAVIAAATCALGYAALSGFWALLPLRLLWGMSFAALNLSTQTLATSQSAGAARRSGKSRGIIAFGPAIALPIGAVTAEKIGPRWIFLVLAILALAGALATRTLPSGPHPMSRRARRLELPSSLDTWSFLEGFTLDGLFVVGLAYMSERLLPGAGVVGAGFVMALRYVSEIVLSPIGGQLADRLGPERLLICLSMCTCVLLVGFGAGWLGTCAAGLMVLRALQLPLLPPIVALRTSASQRVQAIAKRSVWRDIGAGAGPVAAGFLLPVISPVLIFSVSAVFLALATWGCRSRPVCAKPT